MNQWSLLCILIMYLFVKGVYCIFFPFSLKFPAQKSQFLTKFLWESWKFWILDQILQEPRFHTKIVFQNFRKYPVRVSVRFRLKDPMWGSCSTYSKIAYCTALVWFGYRRYQFFALLTSAKNGQKSAFFGSSQYKKPCNLKTITDISTNRYIIFKNTW